MIRPPGYFEPIRRRAEIRWQQLEDDPELAGPWHQLFKQVQSPRHVLSELLQNADDAGATEANVDISGGALVFSHNGEDFTEEHFASLCRFGYSNKRALHTIGFRGIGFKSTFSVGATVELFTPTLSVAFDRQRFTAPRWINRDQPTREQTRIRVVIADEHRSREIQKNLQEWLASPVSLLFFRHIRHVRIASAEVHWGSLGPGPVPDSEWMALNGNKDNAFLIARSGPEIFPEDTLAEIRQERLLSADQEMEFPPCKVELVVGAKGRLYVVLPTGVETSLPFACNAPFIQDPARMKIKDPETSPTNRWLLERVGKLAASVMLDWLNNKSANLADRSAAYRVLPDVDRSDGSMEGSCAAIVEEAFEGVLGDTPFLLTNTGDLECSSGCTIAPQELFAIWPADQTEKLFDEESRPSLSNQVSTADQEKLLNWGFVEKIDKARILKVLQSKHLPKPQTWRQLLRLWAYVAPEVTRYCPGVNRKGILLSPVQGKDVLYSADEVVRLGEKRLLHSENDWKFLSAHLLVLNQNWPRFLAEQRRTSEESSNNELAMEVDAAFAVLHAIELEGTSDVSGVIEQVASEFFAHGSVPLAECIQLAQIAAKIGAAAGGSFRFISRDGKLQPKTHAILFDPDGTLEPFFDPHWCTSHLLHTDYTKAFNSCTSEEWHNWTSSGRAGLLSFAPLIGISKSIWGRKIFAAELRLRGVTETPLYPYSTHNFLIEDWDFEGAVWNHWNIAAQQDPSLWGRIIERIFNQPEASWSKATSARALQVATNGKIRPISFEALLPTWILKLRELPCLRDTRGFFHLPADLLRRTPETEPLLDIEPFVHRGLDTEASRTLLNLLGVRDVPTGPGRLLDRLMALAKATNPPAHEVEKWYRRLDQMAYTCSSDEFARIKQTFHDEKIILTEAAEWTNTTGAFLLQDEEDVPGVALIRAGVRDLMLWSRIGVAQRPTAERAIEWLQELPSGEALSQQDGRRVRTLLTRHAVRIWNECRHWLNLAGEWVPVERLAYALTMQSLVAWSHLHEWVKKKTADLQKLSTETTENLPFSALSPLAAHIEDHFHCSVPPSALVKRPSWLNQLGVALQRIELEDLSERDRIRKLAGELAATGWQTAPGLEIIPYIDGIPAGTPRRTEAFWLNKTLYVEDRPLAKLARAVAQELGRTFRKPEIGDAIKICYDRPMEFVAEYMEENFRLAPRQECIRQSIETMGAEEAPPPSPVTEYEGDTDESLPGPDDSPLTSYEPHNDIDAKGKDDPLSPPIIQSKERDNPKPTRLNIMELFARAQGFKRDGVDRYFRPDGGWIAKTHGARFPWERRAADGALVRYYWPKDHCLQQEPLQLDADVWGLLEQAPENYALVLADLQGNPVEVPGSRLRAMRNAGEITLYPATYRLVFKNDNAE